MSPDRPSRQRHRRRALAALLAGLVLAVLGPATAAFAHAELESSDPAAGAVLNTSPDHITLTFSEPVEISLGAIRLFDGKGNAIEVGESTHPNGKSDAVTVPVPALAEGSYVVDWKVVSADSHPVHAAYTFQVGKTSTLTPGLIDQVVSNDSTGRAAGTVLALSRFLVAAAIAVVVGGLAAIALEIVPPAWKLRRVIAGAGVIGFLAGVLAIPTEAAYAANKSVLGTWFEHDAWSAVLQTRIGEAWIVRALVLAAMGLLLGLGAKFHRAGWWRALGVLGAITLGVASAYGGHGATGRWHGVGVAMTTFHVVGMGLWLGGLLALLVLFSEVGVEGVRRFSGLAACSVAVVVASGVVQAIRQVGTLDALTNTTYGQLLIWKLVGVSLVLFVAALSRRVVHGRTFAVRPVHAEAVGAAPDVDRSMLRRTVGMEVVIAAMILAITSFLMAANPSQAQTSKPFSATLTSNDYLATVTIDPARVGSNQMHIYLSSPSGSLDQPNDVQVQISDPTRDVEAIDVAVQPAGASHYIAEAAEFPYAGTWTLTINARYHQFDAVPFTTSVKISP